MSIEEIAKTADLSLETQAKILYAVDCYLRETINNEDILIDLWLVEGCPDGCESWQDVAAFLDDNGETFAEWMALAIKCVKLDTDENEDEVF